MEGINFISKIRGKGSTSKNKSIKTNCASFEKLLLQYKSYLYKVAYTYVKDKQVALDILQETSFKAWLNIHTLKDEEKFKPWITKILVNTALNYIKKESKVIYMEDENSIIYSEKSISIEEKLDLYDAIDLLKPKYKTVIILKYFDDMKIEDISYVLNTPENTVKSHLKRAKESLSSILKEGI
ncbi:MAG: sigma-70 family RNA polymerase sigma factor [Clostridiales bacterium]|jgi:RNA polymerase sigma-70 factor (ECF subfamily)|uniref:sigma-70 family RNA polymerase sigma factor n=1 Tax=unclassified Clostridium TaxID=2614128 RepID=UPI0018AB15B0|nr:sigma-70 family RNA polymerase sigma factor [Clostridium sp. 1001270J_160509_D11]MDU1203982.1 sigma-70 family RNA polymerase sigma factor [Clostridiales bacterium]